MDFIKDTIKHLWSDHKKLTIGIGAVIVILIIVAV